MQVDTQYSRLVISHNYEGIECLVLDNTDRRNFTVHWFSPVPDNMRLEGIWTEDNSVELDARLVYLARSKHER